MKTIVRSLAALLLALTFCATSQAQLSQEELAKIAQDPLANLISAPLQNQTNFGIGPLDRTQHETKLQPVIPFADGKIIARVVVPFYDQPDLFAENGSTKGFGDVSLSAFYANKGEKVSWGIGPIISLPTAKEGLGVKEWALGPSFVAVTKTGNWVIGGLFQQVWSVESNALNGFKFQPFVNYNLPKGNYLTTSPSITANWNGTNGEKWTVPLGMGVGKIIKPEKFLPVNLQAGAYYNVEKPAFTGADWSLRLSATFMIPTAFFKK